MRKQRNNTTLADMRRRRERRNSVPLIKLLGFSDGKVRLSVCGVEQEVEIGHFVDLSVIEDRKARESIDYMHWLMEHPEQMPLGMLARQWCALIGQQYKEESNGISWLYDDGHRRVHIYDGVWHYPLLGRTATIYGSIEYLDSPIPLRYLTEKPAALMRKRFIEYIKSKNQEN